MHFNQTLKPSTSLLNMGTATIFCSQYVSCFNVKTANYSNSYLISARSPRDVCLFAVSCAPLLMAMLSAEVAGFTAFFLVLTTSRRFLRLGELRSAPKPISLTKFQPIFLGSIWSSSLCSKFNAFKMSPQMPLFTVLGIFAIPPNICIDSFFLPIKALFHSWLSSMQNLWAVSTSFNFFTGISLLFILHLLQTKPSANTD